MNDDDRRPTPEQMLARMRIEAGEAAGATEGSSPREGKLRIFFGYAAGVGKTYAMLQAAQAQKAAGVDVVSGWIEPHGRPETERLLEGLEVLPPLEVPYHGATLREFDLDAALARRPGLLLLDELAHTNAPGGRWKKRWQDVRELLKAGIDVWSTVNVQHVESLNDVVARITGVVVRETIPDDLLFQAAEVELIDVPPDELLDRLKEGKIYLPAQAERALQSFFRKMNLVALRELALRRTADRVSVDVQTARAGAGVRDVWATNDRLLVCIGPSPTSARVLRAARRLADRLGAGLIAVHVAAADPAALADSDRERLTANLRLAERLGAELVELAGVDVAAEVLEYAVRRNVTKIVVGKTIAPRSDAGVWSAARALFDRAFRPTLVEKLIRDSGPIDVYVVRGQGEAAPAAAAGPKPASRTAGWLGAAAVTVESTLVAWAFHALGFAEANVVMVFLLGVVLTAALYGAGPSVAASVAAVVLFDVFFTQPYYSLRVADAEYLVTFTVMLSVGLLASAAAAQSRRLARLSRRNERRAEALYRLSSRLAAAPDLRQLVEQAESFAGELFDAHAVLFLPDSHGKIRPVLDRGAAFAASAAEFAAAQWVFDRRQPAGLGSDALPNLPSLCIPLAVDDSPVGVLSLHPRSREALEAPEAAGLLQAVAAQIASALERRRLADEARAAQVEVERERLRGALLSSVSHDLRTPLAAIAGAGASLRGKPELGGTPAGDELLETICDESTRLARLVDNLLHMTRIESGAVALRREWHPLDEIVGSALGRLKSLLAGRAVETKLPPEGVWACVDPFLLEQVFLNLLENAVKYSAPATSIVVFAEEIPPGSYQPVAAADATAQTSLAFEHGGVRVEVRDEGPGIAAGEEERIFEKFYRGGSVGGRGAGLGLAICKAAVEAHGGRISVRNRPEGGAAFSFMLPHPSPPPSFSPEEEAEDGGSDDGRT